MASQPKRRKLMETLERLAHDELGEDASPLQWAVARIAGGERIGQLADELAGIMGESVSRSWLSTQLNGLTPAAKDQIREARREGATAFREEALEIIDGASTKTREDLRKAELRAKARMDIAEAFDPTRQTQTQVQINLGSLHLDAFRALKATASVSQSQPEVRALPEPAPDLLPVEIEAPQGVEAA